MAQQFSDQTAVSIGGNPQVTNPVKDNGGRVRALCFSIQTSATIGVQNDTIVLGDLPKGARVLGGTWRSGAMGASATWSVGNSTSGTKYLNAASVSSAVENQTMASSLATNFLSTVTAYNGTTPSTTEGSSIAGQLGAVERVIGTFGGATFATAKTLEGYLLYVVD